MLKAAGFVEFNAGSVRRVRFKGVERSELQKATESKNQLKAK
jgi:hypothetical protein